MRDISRSITKIDGHLKSSGKAKYVSDIKMPNLHFAKTVRSTIAKGKIVSINLPPMPSGYYTVDYNDIPGKNYIKMIFEDWPIFAKDTVNHIGEPILLVVGKDKAIIDEIIKNIVIEYEELAPQFEYKESVVQKHFSKGNVDSIFKKDDIKTIEYTYKTGYQEQAYIEPQGFIGYMKENKVTLEGSIQCPYYVKNALITVLDCDPDFVRVIQSPVGGAFGGKEEFPSLMACQLALAVLKVKAPIKMIYEREEDMEVTTKRHPSKIHLKAAISKEHKVLAIKTHVALDSGAYIGLSGVVLSRAMLAVTSAYTIDNLDVSGDVYKTNTVPNGAFRGFGAPQMIFAIEMFMNHIAKDLKIDPFTFRMNHLAKQGDFTSTEGLFRDPIIMEKMIKKATEVSNYHEKSKEYQKPNSFKGIGMSWFLHGCGFTGSGESDHINAKVKLRKDAGNQVYILVAAVDMGQGAKTTLIKVVAHTLDLPYEQVTFDDPDTDFVTDSGPTVASRTAMIVGGLLARCALKMKKNWQDGIEQVETESYVQPDYVKWNESTMKGDAYPAYSWGVNICEVEVDKRTYQVDVKGIWSVYDVGKSLDERIVLGQADGGIAQGIAYGYLEVMQHKDGKIKHKNMTDYIIPTAVDMGYTENYLYENPFALGPYGAKGAGELTLVGGAPAVALAIEQAIGKKIHKIPATPEVIMEVILDENHI
ncbi:xanthine dehydrogenase family protein molybdopterin-binding subunit [Liberiplasma polymorphum]|uniref:xanthine dehydrogenase family protein molybdopterin-binding subunit n=1 Tax=Liberiplasma polymorphum TaxID=3374570 RepID=UPI00377353E9